jgi:hypothetical protein
VAGNAPNPFGLDAGRVHSAYALGLGEPQIRDQEVQIYAEIAGGFDAAAGRRVAKTLNALLQAIHNFILALWQAMREHHGHTCRATGTRTPYLSMKRPGWERERENGK